ncbi:hypothetical protein [Halocatena marina]|uniref:Uncharacterized protein n=1 Tax=Halocatena marina TaxID=2934937 RepID=A0ABD5YQN4_9EURY|nr:hypothetical protein [Halocatena marina]
MSENSTNLAKTLRGLLGILIVIAITWNLFWELIHPVLMSISPIFTYNPDGRVGRYPDSPALIALFATFLVVLYMYYALQELYYEGIEEFIGMLKVPFIIFVIFPFLILKNSILPKLGIDRWQHEEYK